jgi:hypothetical protein
MGKGGNPMSAAAVSESTVSRLNDPNLAFLASRAAIEIDRIRQGKPMAGAAIAKLADILKCSMQSSGTEESGEFWDPITISLIHGAVEARGSTNVTTKRDLLREAVEIANQLAKTAESNTVPSDVERLRAFCVGLANSAIAHERAQIEAYADKSQWS